MNAFDKNTQVVIDDAQLLADEAKYSSFGDTVHYVDPPKIFRRCEGSSRRRSGRNSRRSPGQGSFSTT